ncbi:fasciclin domain-containing protein [Caulobacter sp. DWR1-3-2b1]|uniref:fasciclin domain-containing protein n=1 Tax=Caulobacter sp. DWR1-3-2b1 TaxID=2804670 RepID=UPI003CFA53E3
MAIMTRLALTTFAILALAGCGDRPDKSGAEKSTADVQASAPNRTLAAALQADKAYGGLAMVLNSSGLGAALDGVGQYTVFAPVDPALNGATGANFADPAMKAEGAALLRAHIVPGALTRADIVAAVDRSAGKGAQMRTMGGNLLTFTRSGEDLIATASDGASARITGQESLASNGVLQPLDGLLAKPSAAPS